MNLGSFSDDENADDNSVEIYEIDPFVATYDNILSKKECDHFIEISKDKFKRALVSDSKGGTISSGRTGSNYWLNHDHDKTTNLVANRISKIVGMPLKNAERFQMIYYGENQEYRMHYDSWENNGSEKTLRCIKYGGPRLVTALCYLNTVEKGGGTRMTKLNHTIEAQCGRLLVFNNTTPDKHSIHNRHPLSEHAGMPVIKGYKYAFNLWFKEEDSKKLYSETSPTKYQLYINKANSNESNKNKDSAKEISYTKPTENILTVSSENVILSKPPNFTNDPLDIGDFIPYIKIHGINHTKELYTYGTFKDFIIITHKNLNNIYNIQPGLQPIRSYFNLITVSLYGMTNASGLDPGILYSTDSQLNKLLKVTDELLFYIVNPNRQIKQILTFNTFKSLITGNQPLYNKMPQSVPYILIEDVLDQSLYKKLLDFYNKNKSNSHITNGINLDASLEYDLDYKISKSILPQVNQVFNLNVKYREPYLCKAYNRDTVFNFKKKFNIFRNTIPNKNHRQYTMLLSLNNNFKGGDFTLPEYNLQFKSIANSAIIFPTMCAQQITEIFSGTKLFISAFFINTPSPKYKLRANYFEKNNIVESDIYSRN